MVCLNCDKLRVQAQKYSAMSQVSTISRVLIRCFLARYEAFVILKIMTAVRLPKACKINFFISTFNLSALICKFEMRSVVNSDCSIRDIVSGSTSQIMVVKISVSSKLVFQNAVRWAEKNIFHHWPRILSNESIQTPEIPKLQHDHVG